MNSLYFGSKQPTAAELAKARELRSLHVPWTIVVREVGVSMYMLRMHLEAGFAEKERARQLVRTARQNEQQKRRIRDVPLRPRQTVVVGPTNAQLKSMLSTIPKDTRGLTARMLGDPLPGRSALDRIASLERTR